MGNSIQLASATPGLGFYTSSDGQGDFLRKVTSELQPEGYRTKEHSLGRPGWGSTDISGTV